MSHWIAPTPLSAPHIFDGFDCGKPALNEWLMRHARQAQSSGSARTFVVTHHTQPHQVVAYFSLTVGQVEPQEAPERVSKGMGRYPIPVVILARLAVAHQAQGQGLGVGLLQEAIRRTLQVSEQVGIRALLTHPLDEEAAQFYLRFGFEASPLMPTSVPPQLLLLLKDARRLMK